MDLSHIKGSMATPALIPARKATEMVSDQFPVGLRVLVVDDDPTCLRILEKMLQTCLYAGLFQFQLPFVYFLFLGFSLLILFFHFWGSHDVASVF